MNTKRRHSLVYPRWLRGLTYCSLAIGGTHLADRMVLAQSAEAPNATTRIVQPPSTEGQSSRAVVTNQAYVDFLLAVKLADDGSKPEALKKLAESLRLQPVGNPATGLVFELLTEQRTNSRLLLRGHTDAVLYATYSPDGTKIVTTSADHSARIWDAQTGQQLTAPLQHDDAVLMAAFSQDGRLVVTGCGDETARIWDVATGRSVGAPMHGSGVIQYVQFSPDGKIVATGSDDGKARTWDAKTGRPLSPPIVYHEAVYSTNFSPDGSRVVTATGDSVADLLDSKTGARTVMPLRQNNIIFTAVFSRDGNSILTASADHTAKIWSAKTGQSLSPTFHHGSSVLYASFDQDARRVVTASSDHTARVWDAKTGQPITPPLQHSEAVTEAVFSPDGNFVATASRDHTARLWDAASGESLRLPTRTKNNITAVAFNPIGGSLLIASADSSVQIVDMPPHESAPAWVAEMAEFASTQTKYNQWQLPDLSGIGRLRTQLLTSKATDPWTIFGRWYFLESAVRPISPWSRVSLQQYVESLITLGDKDSLQFARELSYDHPAWIARIIPLQNKVSAAPSVTQSSKQPIGDISHGDKASTAQPSAK